MSLFSHLSLPDLWAFAINENYIFRILITWAILWQNIKAITFQIKKSYGQIH